MPTSYGQVVNSGVKYIKVNRFDSGGLDRSNYLGQLESIRLTYPDRSAIEYPIVTVQEQADYYVYGIVPGYNTSSAGEILDYSFTSSKSNIQSATIGNLIKVKSYTSTTGNSLGYFDSTTGVYTFGNTPNAVIDINVIISNVANSFTVHSIYKNSTQNAYTTISPIDPNNLLGSVTGNGNINIVLTGSNSLTEVETLAVYVENFSFSANADVTMSIIQTTPPFNGSSSLVIFEPEFIDFEYNDYNALFGNADIPQFSTQFMDVDYSQNIVTPINFDLIISGTADKASVQDSNYTSAAWSNIRYNGSRTNSFKFVQ